MTLLSAPKERGVRWVFGWLFSLLFSLVIEERTAARLSATKGEPPSEAVLAGFDVFRTMTRRAAKLKLWIERLLDRTA
jgi:hypothetical protein